jgi:hypothetical protein
LIAQARPAAGPGRETARRLEDGGKAQAEELWAKAVQSKRPPVIMISSDDALIQVS